MAAPTSDMRKLTMVKAINLALHQEMERDDDVMVLGEDVGVDEGVFRVTEGLLKKFGEPRVIDTPLAEGAIIGMAIGMALYGLKPIPELQFSGFAFQAFHQVENHAARYRARTRGRYHIQMTIRMPYGGGVRALEHHSESEEAYYAHTPGLKIVIPSGPRLARALLVSAIRDPDPVVFFEPKALYHAIKEEVPDAEETWPIGRARVAREGKDLTLIGYGAMLVKCLEVADRIKVEDGAEVEVIDLVSISPMDTETIATSVRKTGRAVVAHEAQQTCGVGAEVVARIVETAFLQLQAPVRRVTAPDIVFPGFARERGWLPDAERVLKAVRETLAF
jgi:pyruvate dehydrogenase E1 component beta subunit